MDCNPSGSSVHGISQARILEWVATSFSRGSSRPGGSNLHLLHWRQTLYHWGPCKAPHLMFWVLWRHGCEDTGQGPVLDSRKLMPRSSLFKLVTAKKRAIKKLLWCLILICLPIYRKFQHSKNNLETGMEGLQYKWWPFWKAVTIGVANTLLHNWSFYRGTWLIFIHSPFQPHDNVPEAQK